MVWCPAPGVSFSWSARRELHHRDPFAPVAISVTMGSGRGQRGYPVSMNELKFLELHGDRVAYRDAGDGEVLLLIHGMAGSSATWRSVLPQLSKKFRVIAPDLLGHGESAKPRSDYSLGAFAVFLRDFLDELGVSQATVVGHSLGGGVAMQFVYQHPDYATRLVLISSGGLGPDVGVILRLLSAPGAELVLPIIAPKPVLTVGNKLRSWFRGAGIHSPRGAETWSAYSSLSDRATREPFPARPRSHPCSSPSRVGTSSG